MGGFPASSAAFAMTTSLGDGLGVFLGHCGFYAAAKRIYAPDIDMKTEFKTAKLLGSAAVCSGTLWQPLVDACVASGLGFGATAAMTTVGCGAAFFTGLRVYKKLSCQKPREISPKMRLCL